MSTTQMTSQTDSPRHLLLQNLILSSSVKASLIVQEYCVVMCHLTHMALGTMRERQGDNE